MNDKTIKLSPRGYRLLVALLRYIQVHGGCSDDAQTAAFLLSLAVGDQCEVNRFHRAKIVKELSEARLEVTNAAAEQPISVSRFLAAVEIIGKDKP